MSDLEGCTIALTGGTSGIGREAAGRFAERGATVAAVGRDRDRGRALERETAGAPGEVTFHRYDLAQQSQVRALAAELEEYDRLDVLAHNAGVSKRDRTETPDGIETTLAVNHLAPYLLTHELLEALRATATATRGDGGQPERSGRVVVTASGIHRRGSLAFDDLQSEDGDYDALDAYARSKLANVAFTIELAERLDEAPITANCLHPGFVPSTGLFREASLRTRLAVRVLSVVPGVGTSASEGARRLVRLAADPAFAERSGDYVGGDGVETPAAAARDPDARTRLWKQSATLVGVDPDWP